MRRRTVVPASLAVATAFAVAACGISHKKVDAEGANGGPHPSSASPGPSAPPAPTGTVELHRTLWYEGLKLTFGSATYTPSPGTTPGGTVSTDVALSNTGPSSFNSRNMRIALSLDSHDYQADIEQWPMFLGNADVQTRFTFRVTQPVATLSTAVLTVGAGGQAQAKLSFDPDGATVDLAPEPLTTAPLAVNLPQFKGSVTACAVRADFVPTAEQAHAGKRLINCLVTAQNLTTGPLHLYQPEFVLKYPDGTTSIATFGTIDHGLAAGETIRDVPLAWEIPWPATGAAYTLRVSYLGSGAKDPSTSANTVELPLPSMA